MSLLDIRNLSIHGRNDTDEAPLVDRISLTLADGEILALVGESGSGKSLVAQAVLGMLSDEWVMNAERISFDDIDLLHIDHDSHRALLGEDMAMIFQDPAACLDPMMRVSEQLLESMPKTTPWWQFSRRKRLQALISMLHQVGVRDHERLLTAYPHEISAGLAQKVMIAMAIARRPRLLIADEPTISMEPSTQGQLLRLLSKLNQLHKMSILLLSHDINMAARFADRLAVIYCGQVVEAGPADAIINQPMHPYTEALLASTAAGLCRQPPKTPLPELRGGMPRRDHLPIGCRLGPRCGYARKACVTMPELTRSKVRDYRCHYPLNQRIDIEEEDA